MSVQCRCVQGRRQTQNVECRVQNAKRSGMGHRPADDGPARPDRAGQHRKRRHACAARGCSGRFETPDLLLPISSAFQPLRFPGAAYRTRVERKSPVTLHSALCILHSALYTPHFCPSHFVLRWCAHRAVRTVPGTPGVGFRCAHRVLRTKGHLRCAAESGHVQCPHAGCVWGGQRRNESFCGQSALLRVGSWSWYTIRVCPVPTPTCTTRVVCGTRYSVLGTGYWLLDTSYGVRGTGYGVLGTGYFVRGTPVLGTCHMDAESSHWQPRTPILGTGNQKPRPSFATRPLPRTPGRDLLADSASATATG
jgi:hypothetical protein